MVRMFGEVAEKGKRREYNAYTMVEAAEGKKTMLQQSQALKFVTCFTGCFSVSRNCYNGQSLPG